MQAPRFWRMKQTLYSLQGEQYDEQRSIIKRDRISFSGKETTDPVTYKAALQADVADVA